MQFAELGHGRVLSGLVRNIRLALEATEKPKIDPLAKASESVKFWNAMYPVGTKITSSSTMSKPLETRTQAVVLFGHRAAVYVQNYKGYFDLNDISPLPL